MKTKKIELSKNINKIYFILKDEVIIVENID